MDFFFVLHLLFYFLIWTVFVPAMASISVVTQYGSSFDAIESLRPNIGNNAAVLQQAVRTAIPGVTFPQLSSIPVTSFNCSNIPHVGFYADVETGCQVYRRCRGQRMASYLCPNGTLFNQITLTCDWWYNVNCSRSKPFYMYSNIRLYNPNEYLLDGRAGQAPGTGKAPGSYSGNWTDSGHKQKVTKSVAHNQTKNFTPGPVSSQAVKTSTTTTKANKNQEVVTVATAERQARKGSGNEVKREPNVLVDFSGQPGKSSAAGTGESELLNTTNFGGYVFPGGGSYTGDTPAKYAKGENESSGTYAFPDLFYTHPRTAEGDKALDHAGEKYVTRKYLRHRLLVPFRFAIHSHQKSGENITLSTNSKLAFRQLRKLSR
ncbi:uncharacterized protein LOC129590069 [Paramacrobiotus metropolitanus]|uniref:uncharacterized protein LOC129590069 n=1 Tax=Paramacrobiotus metropolitanus TaxID=2943436 RepID=UPI002445B16C|nr:uncharacterized protein LOC129590069 [Paramacrobiotus metropolitanus]